MKKLKAYITTRILAAFFLLAFRQTIEAQDTTHKDLVGKWLAVRETDSLQLDFVDSSFVFLNIKKRKQPWEEDKFRYRIDTLWGETIIELKLMNFDEPAFILFVRKVNTGEFKAQFYDEQMDPDKSKRPWNSEDKNNTQVFRRL